jgi:hypothetical protein
MRRAELVLVRRRIYSVESLDDNVPARRFMVVAD